MHDPQAPTAAVSGIGSWPTSRRVRRCCLPIAVGLMTQPYRIEHNPRVASEEAVDQAWRSVWPDVVARSRVDSGHRWRTQRRLSGRVQNRSGTRSAGSDDTRLSTTRTWKHSRVALRHETRLDSPGRARPFRATQPVSPVAQTSATGRYPSSEPHVRFSTGTSVGSTAFVDHRNSHRVGRASRGKP
jgi:hypothetical protein